MKRKAVLLCLTVVLMLMLAMTSYAESPSIIGGEEAEPGAWPSMVALLKKNVSNGYSAQFCGGALIASEWVMTAAHCVIGENANSLDVALGRHQLSSNQGERISVTRVIIHPGYDDNTLDNDIALLRLSRASSQPTMGLVLPSMNVSSAGTSSTVIGWGSTGGGFPDKLHQVAVPLVSNATCRASAAGNGVTNNMICAGLPEGGKDSCQGDSGGPIHVRNANNTGWLQVGIVSWGIGCAEPNAYGVYTRVENYINWVTSYTGALPGTGNPPNPTPTPVPPTPQPGESKYEAEGATISGAKIANGNGASGSRFVDYINANNDYIEWSVNVSSSGNYAMNIYYALGSSARPMQVSVNGTAQGTALQFPSTGSWSTWSPQSFTANLSAGVNKIRLTANGNSGPNVDYLEIADGGAPPTGGGNVTFTHPGGSYNGTSGDTVPHSSGLNVAANNSNFSVEYCIQPTQGPTGQWRAVVHKGARNGQRTFAMWMRPGDMRLHYRISTTNNGNLGGDSSASLPLNQPTKVSYVREGNQLKLYINGVLDSQTTLRSTVVSNTGSLHIGDSPWYPGTKGQIGDFTMYDGAITPAAGGCSVGQTPTPTALNFDFGTTSSPVQSGWTRIHPTTNTNVISWSGARPDSHDRGNISGVNEINRDFVFNSQSSTLNLKVGNGLWNITINMGDATHRHDNMKVTAEGVVIGNNVTNEAGQFPYVTGQNIRVTDGVLDITFEDGGGSNRHWVVTRLSLSKADTRSVSSDSSENAEQSVDIASVDPTEADEIVPTAVGLASVNTSHSPVTLVLLSVLLIVSIPVLRGKAEAI